MLDGGCAGDPPFLAVATAPCAEHQHGCQSYPAAHRMHHHGTGEVMELRTEAGIQPVLHTEAMVPGNTFEEGINETDQHEGGSKHGVETRALGHAAGNDGGNGGSEGQQEEELDQFIAILLRQFFRARRRN